MGGSALKEYPTSRASLKDFLEISKNVKETFSGIKMDHVPYLKEKKDFGDLDLIVEMEQLDILDHSSTGKLKELNESFINFISDKFNSREIHNAYPVISFEYRKDKLDETGFQVDLILIPEEFYDFSLNYFSYNDLGNLIGVIYRNMGLRFGHYGLNKEVYHPELRTTKLADLNITNDFYQALSFLGLDNERFKNGFKNREEMFEYVSSSKYFTPEIYSLEESVSNYKSRRRNALRETYREFLKWIEENKKNLNHFDYTKIDVEKEVEVFFDNKFVSTKNNIILKFNEKSLAKERISGEVISKVTGLTHQALGHLTSEFKNKFNNEEEMLYYIKHRSDDELKIDFLSIKDKLCFDGMVGDPKTNPAPLDIKHKEKMKLKRSRMRGV